MLIKTLIDMIRENPLSGLLALFALTIPLLISITIHEWAHGFTAYRFGDPTPKQQGRLSLNPLSHLDPAGTIALFVVGIGWAKPVQINPRNIHGKYRQMMVAFAGPLSNFVVAFSLLIAIYFLAKANEGFFTTPQAEAGLLSVVFFSTILVIRINLALGLLNLLPIPPLDGSNIVRHLLPEKQQNAYFSLARFSIPVLLVLLFTGALDVLFSFAEHIQYSTLAALDVLFGGFF